MNDSSQTATVISVQSATTTPFSLHIEYGSTQTSILQLRSEEEMLQLKCAPPPVKWEHAAYLEELIRTEELRDQVKYAAEYLRHHDFDTIAFAGVSGALISIPTALAMHKTMLVVRKPQDVAACCTEFGSHSSRVVEGNIGSLRYLIMDDLVSSGRTYKRVIEEIAKVAKQAECIGVYTICSKQLRTLSYYD